MKLTIALSVVFVVTVGVTFLTLLLLRASPIGSQPSEHHHHGSPDEQPNFYRPTSREPEFHELMPLPELLVNDTIENNTEQRIQHYHQTLRQGFIPVNVPRAAETELPKNQAAMEPHNAIGSVGSLEPDSLSLAAEREYGGNYNVVLDNELKDEMENFSSIHGNCSHCMKEFKNSTSLKYFGCMCSLFTTMHPTEQDIPSTSKRFENVSCHQHVRSEEACSKLCVSMAASYNELKDDMICASNPHDYSIVTAYLQSKLCEDDSDWIFTGVSSPDLICCNKREAVPC